MTPSLCRVGTPTPPRPASPPPYSPPSPIYCPDPTPSPAKTNTPSGQTASPTPGGNSPGNSPGGSTNVNTGQKPPETTVFKRHTVLIPRKVANNHLGATKLWQQIQSELSKEPFKFCRDITENIVTYDQLVDFAVKCDIPLTWLERAKEDYPQDSQVVVNKVFYEWWDRCNLNVGKKLHMIQAPFVYMGKPAVFNRIMNKCLDLEMLLNYARSNMMPALTGGDGIVQTNKTYVLEDADTLGLESVRKGQITTVQHDLIKTLSVVIRTEHAYTNICDSLGVPLEYGPLAIPKYRTWMSQTEATLIKFFSCHTSYLFRMAKVRTAFYVCGYLTYCDKTLVSLGHRISAINDYATVHNPPNENSSADSCSNLGNVSPRTLRDTRDSVEDSDDEREQTQNAVVSTSNENNNTSPPRESETNAQNLTPVIEYEDTCDQIELTNQDIQGLVSLRFERDEIKGET